MLAFAILTPLFGFWIYANITGIKFLLQPSVVSDIPLVSSLNTIYLAIAIAFLIISTSLEGLVIYLTAKCIKRSICKG